MTNDPPSLGSSGATSQGPRKSQYPIGYVARLQAPLIHYRQPANQSSLGSSRREETLTSPRPTFPVNGTRKLRSAPYQPQRGCALQPRVARHELPWVNATNTVNPNGVVAIGSETHFPSIPAFDLPQPLWGCGNTRRLPRVGARPSLACRAGASERRRIIGHWSFPLCAPLS